MTRTTSSRKRAERRGRFAETLAALMLMVKGYRIVAQRARTPFGEVDIAALKGDVLAIVEVKARKRSDDALYAITARSQKRIAQAGLALSQRLRLKGVRLRFDVISVSPREGVRHLRDAWRSGERS